MNVTCNDRDRIFEDGTLAEWAALEAHAANCLLCAEELRAWKSLSFSAQELRGYTESPTLCCVLNAPLPRKQSGRPSEPSAGAGIPSSNISRLVGRWQRPAPSFWF